MSAKVFKFPVMKRPDPTELWNPKDSPVISFSLSEAVDGSEGENTVYFGGMIRISAQQFQENPDLSDFDTSGLPRFFGDERTTFTLIPGLVEVYLCQDLMDGTSDVLCFVRVPYQMKILEEGEES